jgi:hypothetical protein
MADRSVRTATEQDMPRLLGRPDISQFGNRPDKERLLMKVGTKTESSLLAI